MSFFVQTVNFSELFVNSSKGFGVLLFSQPVNPLVVTTALSSGRQKKRVHCIVSFTSPYARSLKMS